MSTQLTGLLSPQTRNGSQYSKSKSKTGCPPERIRPGFLGKRDCYGRAVKCGQELATPTEIGKHRTYPIAPAGYVFGVKPWLKRKEVWWEYGISPRSLRRLEIRAILHPHVLTGEHYYDRDEIDAEIRNSKLLDRSLLGMKGAK